MTEELKPTDHEVNEVLQQYYAGGGITYHKIGILVAAYKRLQSNASIERDMAKVGHAALRIDAATLRAKLAEAATYCGRYHVDESVYDDDMAAANAALDQARAKLAEAEAANASLREHLFDADYSVKFERNTCAELRAALTEARAKLADSERVIGERNELLNEVCADLKAAEAALTEARADLEAVKADRQAIMDTRDEMDRVRYAEIRSLTGQLEACREALGETTADYNRVFLEADDRRIERDRARAEAESLRAERNEIAEEIGYIRNAPPGSIYYGVACMALDFFTQHREKVGYYMRAIMQESRAVRAEAALREVRAQAPGYYGASCLIDAYFTQQTQKGTES